MAAPLTRWEQREGDRAAAKDDESLHDGSLPCVSSTGLEGSTTLVRTSSRSRSGDADRPTGKTNHLRAFVRAGSNFSMATATSAVSDDNDELLPSQISRSQMIRMYLADESSNRLVGNLAVFCGLISLTVLLVLAYRTDWWKGIRGILNRHKKEWPWVLLSLLVEMVFVTVPLPGRGIWTMLVGHEYGYIQGFTIVIIGMLVGSSLAFMAARQISQRLCAGGSGDREEWHSDSRVCCCGRRARWHRLLDIVITSMEVLEEQPLRSVSLLSLSVPPSLMSWALGANTSSSKLPVWRFLVGSLPGCITQIIPIHLGASLQQNDVEKLLAGKCAPEQVWRFVSVIFAICTSIAVGRIAWQRLKQDSEANCRYQHIETGSGSLTLSLCRG